MTRLKSTLATALGMLFFLAAFGAFASIGLAVVGLLAVLGASAALVIGLKSLIGGKRDLSSAAA